MPNWTPGPWKTERANCGDQHPLAVIPATEEDGLIPWSDPAAHLIAAAPELYDALLAVQKTSGVSDELYAPHNHDLYMRVEAALAKARGEK